MQKIIAFVLSALWLTTIALAQGPGPGPIPGTTIPIGPNGSILYFSGGAANTTAPLTLNLPVLGGGTGSPSVGSVSGNTTKFATVSGTFTSGHCVAIDASGNFIDSTGPCAAGSGSVNTGTINHLGFYAATGTAISNSKIILTQPTTAATLSFPTDNATITFQGTDTYVGRATTDTLTNKTFDTAGSGNNFSINGQAIATVSGNTSKVATASGSLVNGHCVSIDASGNLVDAGGACTTGGGGGTVSAASVGQFAIYTGSTTVAGSATGSGVVTALGNNANGAGGFVTSPIANANLANSSTTINGTSIALGASGTVTAAAGTLTGSTLSATVTGSSLTSVGTLATGVWQATAVGYAYGGTGLTALGTAGQCLQTNGSATAMVFGSCGGSGTVTSVGFGASGIFSWSGGPITSSGTATLTVSGTSGGVPYFSGSTTLASSSILTLNAPVLGGGSGGAPTTGSRTGNTTTFATATGAFVSGNCVKMDASSNIVNAGVCGTPLSVCNVVTDGGAVGNGSTDDYAAIMTCVNTGKTVYFPATSACYYVGRAAAAVSDITITTPGQKFVGDGRTRSVICTDTAANFTNGVLYCNTGEPGPQFQDIGVTFTQPSASLAGGATTSVTTSGGNATINFTNALSFNATNSVVQIAGVTPTSYNGTFPIVSATATSVTYATGTTGAQTVAGTATIFPVNTYVPAIYCQNAARMKIDRVRLSNAIYGLDGRGELGGATISDLEVSTVRDAVLIDGSHDTVYIDRFRHWPFSKTGIMSSNMQVAMYTTGQGMNVGRVDGLFVNDFMSIGRTSIATFAGGSGIPWITVNNFAFDSFNGLNATAGIIQLTNGYASQCGVSSCATLGVTGATLYGVSVSGSAIVKASNIWELAGNEYASPFLMQACTACVLQIENGRFYNPVGAVSFVAVASNVINGVLKVSGATVALGSTTNAQFVFADAPGSGENTISLVNNSVSSTPSTTHANPVINISTGNRIVATTNTINDCGSGCGTFIRVQSDDWNVVNNNIAPGWTLSLPTETIGCYTVARGCYNPH